MSKKVLILGGSGRIGRSVATDILTHTSAQVTITGRSKMPPKDEKAKSNRTFQSIDLADESAVEKAIASHDLIVHCAGPFRSRNHHVLNSCIAQGKSYIDVADSPDYVNKALKYREEAQAAGVTAVISTGIFPGISGSMVRQGIEQ